MESTTLTREVNFAGIDYHKRFSMITLGDGKGKPVLTQRVPNDKYALQQFFKAYKSIEIAIESCRGYEWLVDYLTELGHKVHLSNPYQTKLIAQSRCKTDKVDSRTIMQLLAIGFLPTCYQPTPEERLLRERVRWRAHLVRHATKMKVKIHSILAKENLGLDVERLFNSAGRKFLVEVPLSAPRKALLSEHLNLLGYYEDMVERENAWISRQVKDLPDAQLLMTIPGIGELTALVIVAELGQVTRFSNSDQVAAYAGMVPRVYSSAANYSTGRLTKQGPGLLRWMLVQAAWQAIRFCLPLRMHYLSVTRRGGKHAAIISVARKLLRIAFRVLKDRRPFDPKFVGQPAA